LEGFFIAAQATVQPGGCGGPGRDQPPAGRLQPRGGPFL